MSRQSSSKGALLAPLWRSILQALTAVIASLRTAITSSEQSLYLNSVLPVYVQLSGIGSIVLFDEIDTFERGSDSFIDRSVRIGGTDTRP